MTYSNVQRGGYTFTVARSAKERCRNLCSRIFLENKNIGRMEFEEKALCPVCEGDYRHFYKLVNDRVILYCEECSSVWLTPEKIGWEDGATCDDIKKNFIGGRWVLQGELDQNNAWRVLKNPLLFREM
uniref:Transcription factor zinc-finger domain-containing protein n=1 Tax=Marseillevirus sp. TaxID=2809551 RepID=A0AA96J3H0_9VIRU|nr:hypothetical protein MarQu_378 [Marseillevirus sp.]WNL50055.1 hypothetical protein MarDSR_016 [Marseillevirus sp.]